MTLTGILYSIPFFDRRKTKPGSGSRRRTDALHQALVEADREIEELDQTLRTLVDQKRDRR